MADVLHVETFQSGPEKWNKWRQENPDVQPDLSGAIIGQHLSSLHRYDKPGLNRRVFGAFTLRRYANMDLRNANLRQTSWREVDLSGCNFHGADLEDSEFRQAEIVNANFENARVVKAVFLLTKFEKVSFTGAQFGFSHFGYSPFLNCIFRDVKHYHPSHADFLTLYHSIHLPYSDFIAHCRITQQEWQKIEKSREGRYPDCFISYSTKNERYATSLRQYLLNAGVPCWHAPSDYRLNLQWYGTEKKSEELTRDLYNFIDAASVIILLVSRHSLASEWVKREIERSLHQKRIIPLLIEPLGERDYARQHWLKSVFSHAPIITDYSIEATPTAVKQLLPVLEKH